MRCRRASVQCQSNARIFIYEVLGPISAANLLGQVLGPISEAECWFPSVGPTKSVLQQGPFPWPNLLIGFQTNFLQREILCFFPDGGSKYITDADLILELNKHVMIIYKWSDYNDPFRLVDSIFEHFGNIFEKIRFKNRIFRRCYLVDIQQKIFPLYFIHFTYSFIKTKLHSISE